MVLPKLACICCTYARPQLLAEAVECFLRQDYPADRCELIILDDAGQYATQSNVILKPWHLVSVTRRFATLGEKRNAAAALASADVDALVVWDDDDIYLPWALRAHAAALAKAPWSRPSYIYVDVKSGRTFNSQPCNGLFHSAWAFTREAFARVRGYPFMPSGQDQALAHLFQHAGIAASDAITVGFAPFVVYRWRTTNSYHLSAMNAGEGYARLAAMQPNVTPVTRLIPGWSHDYLNFLPDAASAVSRRRPLCARAR